MCRVPAMSVAALAPRSGRACANLFKKGSGFRGQLNMVVVAVVVFVVAVAVVVVVVLLASSGSRLPSPQNHHSPEIRCRSAFGFHAVVPDIS